MEQKTAEEIKSGFEKFIEKMGKPSEYNRMYGHHFKSFSAGVEFATQSNQANGGEGKGVLESLKEASDFYFHKKDYISAGQINRAIDIVGEYLTTLPSTPSIPSSKGFPLEVVKEAFKYYAKRPIANIAFLEEDFNEFIKAFNQYTESSKGAFSVEDVINIHIEIMKKGLIEEGDKKWEEGYEPKIRKTATEYIHSLTPQSHQPEVKDSWDEILRKFHASNNSDESGYMLIEWLKENYNTPFQSSTKAK